MVIIRIVSLRKSEITDDAIHSYKSFKQAAQEIRNIDFFPINMKYSTLEVIKPSWVCEDVYNTEMRNTKKMRFFLELYISSVVLGIQCLLRYTIFIFILFIFQIYAPLFLTLWVYKGD